MQILPAHIITADQAWLDWLALRGVHPVSHTPAGAVFRSADVSFALEAERPSQGHLVALVTHLMKSEGLTKGQATARVAAMQGSKPDALRVALSRFLKPWL